MAGTVYTLLFTRTLAESDKLKLHAHIERQFGSHSHGEFSAQKYVIHYSFGEDYPGEYSEIAGSIAELNFVPKDSLAVSVWVSASEAVDLTRSLSFDFAELLETEIVVHEGSVLPHPQKL